MRIDDDMREIPGHPGYYITRDGRVFSKHSAGHGQIMPTIQRQLRASNDKDGYPRLKLGRKTTRLGVHRLVLLAWVGPPPVGTVACHNNDDRSDCRLENLRWDTIAANNRDAILHDTSARGERNGVSKLTEAQVREIRSRKAAGESAIQLSRMFGIAEAYVYMLVRRQWWRHVE